MNLQVAEYFKSFFKEDMSFLDIDTILAEEERLPCTFKYDAEKLGFLDPTNEEDTVLPASSKVELPVW